MKYYTGIGSRKTPQHICRIMTKLAVLLRNYDYVLRSGHAEGADKAFEIGARESKEIYIPWHYFNGSESKLYHVPKKAKIIAKDIHPAWDRCSDQAKLLHARNVMQVLGMDFKSPSEFVLCWTPNARNVGGTATAIKLANVHNIPVFNLANRNIRSKIITYINKFNWKYDI